MDMIQSREENGRTVIALSGRITTANAPEIETQIREAVERYGLEAVELDCDGLEYCSSSGLRVILRLKKRIDHTIVANVHSELYEIFEMTGFTEMMEIRRAYRVISLEGCEVLDAGANGRVYRIDPETIVKAYRQPDALPEIRQEQELARLAFVAGVPTAIPYDVVRIREGGYGSVFELLNARGLAKLLAAGEKTLEEVAEASVSLLKLIHSREIQSPSLPDMKSKALGWVSYLQEELSGRQLEKLRGLIEAVPEEDHLLHGDYHIKNVMMQDGEALLIDMDTLCHGHPIFELGSMYNAYVGYGLIRQETIREYFGIDPELCHQLWRRTLELYLDTEDPARIRQVEEKAMIIGLTRIIRREIRRDGKNRPEGRQMIALCEKMLSELLERVDTLEF